MFSTQPSWKNKALQVQRPLCTLPDPIISSAFWRLPSLLNVTFIIPLHALHSWLLFWILNPTCTALHVGKRRVNVSILHRSCLNLLFWHSLTFLASSCVIARSSSAFAFTVTWFPSMNIPSFIYLVSCRQAASLFFSILLLQTLHPWTSVYASPYFHMDGFQGTGPQSLLGRGVRIPSSGVGEFSLF